MSKLSKPRLLALLEHAFRSNGWQILTRQAETNPAKFSFIKDDRRLRAIVYIWNITPGGNHRPANERRIQITPAEPFAIAPKEKTLVLGWDDDLKVFAGWDVRQHSGPLGSSPSFQITRETLSAAASRVFAPYTKANGETAIAFRPSFVPTYVEFLEELHTSGSLPEEKAVLDDLSTEPGSISDVDIEGAVAPPRQVAIITTKKAVRAIDFRDRILGAYNHECAMCGIQLRLIDGAHILPVAHPSSTDDTQNGIALCALHHRAYDRGLVMFDAKYKTKLRDRVELAKASRDGGYSDFEGRLFASINVPSSRADRPSAKFIDQANTLRGW